jgi:hypothetical protein
MRPRGGPSALCLQRARPQPSMEASLPITEGGASPARAAGQGWLALRGASPGSGSARSSAPCRATEPARPAGAAGFAARSRVGCANAFRLCNGWPAAPSRGEGTPLGVRVTIHTQAPQNKDGLLKPKSWLEADPCPNLPLAGVPPPVPCSRRDGELLPGPSVRSSPLIRKVMRPLSTSNMFRTVVVTVLTGGQVALSCASVQICHRRTEGCQLAGPVPHWPIRLQSPWA